MDFSITSKFWWITDILTSSIFLQEVDQCQNQSFSVDVERMFRAVLVADRIHHFLALIEDNCSH